MFAFARHALSLVKWLYLSMDSKTKYFLIRNFLMLAFPIRLKIVYK